MKKRIFIIAMALMLMVGSSIMALPARPVLAVNYYTLNIQGADEGGHVTSPGENNQWVYAEGTVVSLLAVPSTGYSFTSWIGDTGGIASVGSASTTITMNGNYYIGPTFSVTGGTGGGGGTTTTTFIVSASAGANGTISPSGDTSVTSGGSMTYYITPSTGYRIDSVTVDGSSVGAVANYTFSSVTSAHTITATFALNTFNITASAGSNGAITPAGVISVNYGSSQTYAITPATGYHTVSVLVDGASVGVQTAYTFNNVVIAHTISATFAINTYTLTATAGANGTITPQGATTINYGSSQVYAITPSTGYHVVSVLVDGVSAGPITVYTFSTVTGDHTISVTFAINTYTVTATAGDHGTVTPPGASTINYGGNQSYIFTPSTGYHVANLLVDGAFMSANTSYQFANITTNHTVSVTFAINTYTITPTVGQHGTISPFVAIVVNYGDTQIFTISPATGYRVSNVTIDGAPIGAVSSYTFSNITKNHTIDVAFTIGWPFYAAFAIGGLLVFLLGYLVGKKTGGGG